MRRYDDPVDVLRGEVAPDQFLWRGRLWKVREVVAHWVETGSWWAGAAQGAAGSSALDSSALAAEREVWRVEASPGRAQGSGVFELCFDWAVGGWRLLRAVD